MDINKKKERNLSKPICLNKDLTEYDLQKYKNNYETMGYHFNNHYSTMAYVFYYLMRVIPFTYNQIKLQSGNFDAPSRLFSSLENLLGVFKISDENRELCPEFFFSYESFLNLNYNDFGYSKVSNKQINHLDTNQNVGIVQFIIDLRKILEQSELAGWINNIFGSNQYNNSIDSFNTFPEYSYEQCNNFNKEKEQLHSELGEEELSEDKKIKFNDKINDIRGRIQLLSLGLTPSQLFKHPHPTKEKNSKSLNKSKVENLSNNNKKDTISKRRKSNIYFINKSLTDFIQKTSLKNILYIFDNDNNRSKVIVICRNKIKIFNLFEENEKNIQSKNIDLGEEIKLINIKPYTNLFVELYDNVFVISRLTNNTLLLCSENQKIYIEWPCIVTSIELYSHDEININSTTIIHINKILVGDEEGTLSLVEIEAKYNDKNKEFKLNSLSYIHKRYKSFYSYINRILYNKNLNIIISSCKEGYISINNGFSFEILNIIEIEQFPNILDFKISEFNLLYFYTCKYIDGRNQYTLYCYTLNGIKISKLCLEKDIINFFTYKDSIFIIYKNLNINEYNCSNFKKIEGNIDKEDIKSIEGKGEIFYSVLNSKLDNIFIFLNKDIKIIRINTQM